MMGKMCGVKLSDRKNTSELMERKLVRSGKEKWIEMDVS